MHRLRLLLPLLAVLAVAPVPGPASAAEGPAPRPAGAFGAHATPAAVGPALAPVVAQRGQRGQRGEGRPSPLERYFEDPAAVEAGRAAIERMQRARGAAARVEEAGVGVTLDVWPSLPGLRYQLLETTYEYSGRRTDEWNVHHRLPRLVHLAPGDRGYVLTEVVTSPEGGETYRAAFQRMVVDGRVAWSELQGESFERSGDRNARMLLTRELVLGTLPLGLADVGVDFALVRRDADALVVAVRLGRPAMFSAVEVLRYLVLYLDPETAAPLQWQFQTEEMRTAESEMNVIWTVDESVDVPLPEAVRADLERRLVEAWRAERIAAWRAAGNEGEAPAELTEARPGPGAFDVPTALTLPALQIVATKPQSRIKRFELAEPAVLPLPEGALDRPWLTNQLWVSPARADHWDPPAPAAGDGRSEG